MSQGFGCFCSQILVLLFPLLVKYVHFGVKSFPVQIYFAWKVDIFMSCIVGRRCHILAISVLGARMQNSERQMQRLELDRTKHAPVSGDPRTSPVLSFYFILILL